VCQGIIQLFDTTPGDEVARLPTLAAVRGMAFDSDSRRVRAMGEDGSIITCDASIAIGIRGDGRVDLNNPEKEHESVVLVQAETGKVLRRGTETSAYARWLVFSPDGSRLTGGWCVWDVATMREVKRLPHNPEITAAAFRPDGKLLATGCSNGTAQVWSLEGK
jgi:WD40 repeat protein